MGGWGIWETVNGEQKLTTECIKVFPPAMVEILKAKVAAEQAEAAAEKKNSAEEK